MTSPSSAICRKELLVALRSRSFWLAAAALACAAGALSVLSAEGPVPAQALCLRLARMMPFCVAFATMGRFAGSRGDGRLESVLSAPVSPAEVVAGQFFAGLALSLLFMAACAAPSLAALNAGAAPVFSSRAPASVVAGLAALALATAAVAAFGTLSSLACGSEASSAAVTLLAGSAAVAAAVGDVPGFPPPALSGALDPTRFATGTVDSRFVVLCLTSTALFSFLAVRLLESGAYVLGSRH